MLFHFHGLGNLRYFLDNLRPVVTSFITKLALNYHYYGHPRKTANQVWKMKHDALWNELCWRVADSCSQYSPHGQQFVFRQVTLTKFTQSAETIRLYRRSGVLQHSLF